MVKTALSVFTAIWSFFYSFIALFWVIEGAFLPFNSFPAPVSDKMLTYSLLFLGLLLLFLLIILFLLLGSNLFKAIFPYNHSTCCEDAGIVL